jgi:hypothetical protein
MSRCVSANLLHAFDTRHLLSRVGSISWLAPAAVLSFLLSSCGGQVSHATRPGDASAFAVLRQPRTADDVLPKQIADSLRETERPAFSSQDVSAARRILANTPAWLLPADNGEVCLAMLEYPVARGASFAPIPLHGCVPEGAARLGKLVLVRSLATVPTTSDSRAQVLGIVPDGVPSITVRARDPRLSTVAVLRNAYSLVVNGPRQMHFQTRRSGRRTVVAVPLTTPKTSNTAPDNAPVTGSF